MDLVLLIVIVGYFGYLVIEGFRTGNAIVAGPWRLKANRSDNPVGFWSTTVYNAALLLTCVAAILSL